MAGVILAPSSLSAEKKVSDEVCERLCFTQDDRGLLAVDGHTGRRNADTSLDNVVIVNRKTVSKTETPLWRSGRKEVLLLLCFVILLLLFIFVGISATLPRIFNVVCPCRRVPQE